MTVLRGTDGVIAIIQTNTKSLFSRKNPILTHGPYGSNEEGSTTSCNGLNQHTASKFYRMTVMFCTCSVTI